MFPIWYAFKVIDKQQYAIYLSIKLCSHISISECLFEVWGDECLNNASVNKT